MADFLSRLAEQSLGLTPIAQPLVAPMFAPGPAAASDASSGVVWDERSIESPAVPGHDAPPFEERGTFSPSYPPGSVPPFDMSLAASPSRAPGAPAHGEQHTLEDPTPAAGQWDPAGAPALNERAARRTNWFGALFARTRPEHERGSDVRPLPAAGSAEATRDPRAGQGQANLFGLVHAGDEQALTSADEPAPVSGMARPRVTLRSAPLEPPLADREGDAPQPQPSVPTIRVTIGRIEVRAITPPAPPPPRATPARPTPALSLDEYLKRYREGTR